MTSQWRHVRRSGVNLLEILAVVTVLGILAAVVVPRFATQSQTARHTSCSVIRHNIQIQCQLWQRQKSQPPQGDLSDIGIDRVYFPDGLPSCPVDGTAYRVHPTTLDVIGHVH